MAHKGPITWVSVAVTLAAAAALLTGCSTAGAAGNAAVTSSLTLAETKSPAQLLRNTVITRLSPDKYSSHALNQDASVGCGLDDKIRYWKSSVVFNVDENQEYNIKDTVIGLAKTFTADGWQDLIQDTPDIYTVTLHKQGISSVMVFTAKQATTASGIRTGGQITIEVDGPCVKTDGPFSKEVETLEGKLP